MLTDFAFNAIVDYLSPADYDGKAMLSMSASDKRLRAGALLAWEGNNARDAVVEVLKPLCAFFSSLKARDKVGRLIQYICRLLQAVLQRSGQRLTLVPFLRKIILTLSEGRRTFRVLEVGPLLTLARGVSTAEPCWQPGLAATLFSALFNIADRLRWLQEHRIISGDPKPTGRRAMRLLCACHGAQCLRLVMRALLTAREASREAWASSAGGNSGRNGGSNGGRNGSGSQRRRDEEIRQYLRDAFKQALCFLQAAHIGKVPGLATSDIAIGVMGVYTTSVDLRDMWAASRKSA